MIIVTSGLGVLGMIILPIALGFWLTRKFKLSWKLWFAGAATFIASQAIHIPFLAGATALFNNGTFPSPPQAWAAVFNAVFLGLAAGLFEETSRYVLYKFFLKKANAWNDGVLVGAGHGGIEALIVGILGALTLTQMVAMRNADLSALGVPAAQVEAVKQQVAAFWSSPAYAGLLGLVERIFAICLHLSLSIMVLYSVAYKKPLWFWIALFWHAFVDAAAVHLLPILGALGVEGVIAVMAIISLATLFKLKSKFTQTEPLETGQGALIA